VLENRETAAKSNTGEECACVKADGGLIHKQKISRAFLSTITKDKKRLETCEDVLKKEAK
jgi:hypothetical protein